MSKQNPRALFVLTSNDQLGPANSKTGYFLSEVTHPYDELIKAEINIDFASPMAETHRSIRQVSM